MAELHVPVFQGDVRQHNGNQIGKFGSKMIWDTAMLPRVFRGMKMLHEYEPPSQPIGMRKTDALLIKRDALPEYWHLGGWEVGGSFLNEMDPDATSAWMPVFSDAGIKEQKIK
ncbi:hypothetical protein ACLOJK_028174 [Asimina triloba]